MQVCHVFLTSHRVLVWACVWLESCWALYVLEFGHMLWQRLVCVRCLLPGARHQVPSTGTRHLIPSTRYLVPGRYLVPRTRYLVLDTGYFVLVFGNLFSERLCEFDPVFDLHICLCSVNGVLVQPCLGVAVIVAIVASSLTLLLHSPGQGMLGIT